MKILGISAYFHDAAAALVVDGKVVAAAPEERFSRRKHDAALPVQATRFCLERANLRMEDVDHVVFHEKPLRKFDRILQSGMQGFPRSIPTLARSLRTWLAERLWLKADLCRTLGCSPAQLLFSEHHLSHAASSFLTSPHASAAILTVDGVGEWCTTAIHRGVTDGLGTRIETLRELHFPHSIGLFYSALTAYLGFEVNEGEYKVMGLASYGQPRFLEEMRRMCRVAPDGSLELDLSFFAFHLDPERSFSEGMETLLGPSRAPGTSLRLPPQDQEAQRYADIAASLQRFTEDAVLAMAHEAHRLTGEKALCLAGGVALNCVSNRRLAEDGPFETLHVHPAAGDAGAALGAALWVSHGVLGLPRPAKEPSVFLGESWSAAEVDAFFTSAGARHQTFTDDGELMRLVAARLAAGEVGGFFRGRAEWGPRALGARSILADARHAGMKDRVNRTIKFREGFRPFAPAVLAEDAATYFNPGRGADDALTPWMLTTRPVTPEGANTLPAITHVDGSARVQTVTAEQHPHLHALLVAFRQETGVGALLNTSLNLKDEPVVGTPADAWALMARSGLDFMVVEQTLLTQGHI